MKNIITNSLKGLLLVPALAFVLGFAAVPLAQPAAAFDQTIGGETPLAKACMFCQGDIIEWYLNNALKAF